MSNKRMVAFELEVHVLEDLHAGSGLGGADVDALLARDRQGRPVLRWSHLRGLLKQALFDRGAALGQGVDADSLDFFGRPHLEENQPFARGALQGRGLRISAGSTASGSVVWVSTARVPGSRVPKTDTLRRVEYVCAGTRFQGEVRVPDEASRVALLAKLLKRINRLGGDRSRGAGLVSVTVTQKCIDAPTFQPAPNVAAAVPDGHRVLFKAIDPVALGATGSPGNLIRAHSHLSSSAVTGMLVRWALESGCAALADALLDRRIACGPAYPLPPHAFKSQTEKLDAVPFPLSFQSPKPAGQAGAQPWWAADPVPDAWVDTLEEERKPEAERQGEKLKRPGAHDYLVRIGEQWQRFRCEPGEAMRNNAGTSQRAGIKQDLFSQEEVPEDTGFLSRIVAADADAEALLLPALVALAAGGYWLQAGRGGAPMAVHAHSRADAGDSSAADGNGPQPTRVRLYVESDLILRADDLRFRTRLDRDAVLHLLTLAGADLALLTRVRNSVDVLEVSEPVEVRGRNVATAGPRLPALAIRRGSEADLRFKDAVDAQACRMVLQGLALRGAGERALEGHGRLRVDFAPVQGTDEMTKDGELDDIRVHEDELLLETAALWLKRKGFPRGFSPKRWQDLRNAARANGPELFRAWLVQAAREADRLAQRSGGGSGGDDGAVGWLNALRELVVKDLNTHRPLLRTLGLLAAKKAVAASKRDKRARVEEVAATNPGERGAA